LRRLGDNGQLVLLQLVGSEDQPEKKSAKKPVKKQKKPGNPQRLSTSRTKKPTSSSKLPLGG
jgi:hypothetical protein